MSSASELGSRPPRILRWRATRPVAFLLAFCAVVLSGLWVVDSFIAMRVETKIAHSVQESADLATTPSVYLNSFPFSTSTFWNFEVRELKVNSLDVAVEGLGIVNAETSVQGIKILPLKILRGDLAGSEAQLYRRTISLDGVAFGQLLEISDLDISNPYDISPRGGVSSEAQLTGTPLGFTKPITVKVSLRLDGPMFKMRVTDIVDVPKGREADAVEAFTYSFDTRRLPLNDRAVSVELQGGSLYFQTQRQNVRLSTNDLAPLDSGAGVDAAATDNAFTTFR